MYETEEKKKLLKILDYFNKHVEKAVGIEK